MSISKLESLPNEILVQILEKYINGMDILVAFLYQQNQRFDALISQCQRFSVLVFFIVEKIIFVFVLVYYQLMWKE